MTTREQVFTAIAGLLEASGEFATVSRSVAMTPDMPDGASIALPAAYVLEGDETTSDATRGAPPVRKWEAAIAVYCRNPDRQASTGVQNPRAGAEILNPLLEIIEAIFAPDDLQRNVCSLGGIVHGCRIEGQTIKFTGDIMPDGIAFAAVPLVLIVP